MQDKWLNDESFPSFRLIITSNLKPKLALETLIVSMITTVELMRIDWLFMLNNIDSITSNIIPSKHNNTGKMYCCRETNVNKIIKKNIRIIAVIFELIFGSCCWQLIGLLGLLRC